MERQRVRDNEGERRVRFELQREKKGNLSVVR